MPLPKKMSLSPISARVIVASHDPSFLTQQALVQRISSARNAAGQITFAYQWSKNNFGSALARPRLAFKPLIPTFNEWSRWDLWTMAMSLSGTVFSIWAHPHHPTYWIFYFFGTQAIPAALRVILGHTPDIHPAQMNCGNLAFSGEISLEELEELLKPSITDLLNRGFYSFGYSFMVPVKRKVPHAVQLSGFETNDEQTVWEYRVRKVWVHKRANAVQKALNQIKSDFAKVRKDANMPKFIMFSFHSRLGSVGSNGESVQDLEEAAQPGVAPPQGQPEDWQLRWNPVRGTATPHMDWLYVIVTHLFQFNGDIGATKALSRLLAGHKIGNSVMRARAARWLGYTPKPEKTGVWRLFHPLTKFSRHIRSILQGSGKVAPGDAPLEAMILKLVNTERLFKASIIYALFFHVIDLDDPRDQHPPLDKVDEWNRIIQTEFKKWVSGKPEVAEQFLRTANTQKEYDEIQKVMLGHAQAFEEVLVRDQTLKDSLETFLKPEERLKFLHYTTLAFWRNSLDYAVLEEMKPRIDGTQASDASTTLNPPDGPVSRVQTSLGQNLVYGVIKGGRVVAMVSDRIVLPKGLVTERVLMRSDRNASAIFGKWGDSVSITLTEGIENIVKSKQDVRMNALRPFESRENGQGVHNPLKEEEVLENSARAAAMVMPKVHRKWEAVHDVPGGDESQIENRIPAVEFTRVAMRVKIARVIQIALKANGLSEVRMDRWVQSLADRLSRDLWMQEITTDAAIHEIERLARAERLKVNPTSSEPHEIDYSAADHAVHGVIVATGKTRLAALKFARSAYLSMGLHYDVQIGNKVVKLSFKHRDDVDGFLHDLKIDQHTPIVLATDSGAETYEKNILKAYLPYVTEEPFGIAGTDDNQLVDSFGAERVFTTFNFGSKTQDGLPAYAAMVQTFEELSLFMSENISKRFKTGGENWKKAPFFRSRMTYERIVTVLKRANRLFVTTVPERMLGYTESGARLEDRPGSNESANLRAVGEQTAERQLEAARKWLVNITYVLTTVIGSIFGIGPIFYLMTHIAGLSSAFWLDAAKVGDACFYVSFGLSWLLVKRTYLRWRGKSDTKLFEGFGLPTFLFVSPFDWVHAALADTARAAQGLAYSMTKSYFDHTENAVANDDHRATANRNSIAILLRPGTEHRAYEFENSQSDQIGRHFLTQMSLPLPERLTWVSKLISGIRPTPPKVIDAGTATLTKQDDAWGKMARSSEVKVRGITIPLPPGESFENLDYDVAEYILEQYESMTWYLQYTRVLYTQLHRVAQGFLGVFFKYPEGRFFGGGAVKSTKASANGEPTLDVAQEMARTRPMRMIPIGIRPAAPLSTSGLVVLDAGLWKSWPREPWLAGEPISAHEMNQPAPRALTASRPSTATPATRSVEVVLALPVAPEDLHVVSRVGLPDKSPSTLGQADELSRRAQAALLKAKAAAMAPKTSIVTKEEGEPVAADAIKGTFEISPKGTVSKRSVIFEPAAQRLVSQVLKTSGLGKAMAESKDRRPLLVTFHPINNRPAFYNATPDNSETRGVIVLDSHLAYDWLTKVEGAQSAVRFKLFEEMRHALHDILGEIPEPIVDLEFKLNHETFEQIVITSKRAQMEHLTYWRRHSAYDPKGVYADILEKALERGLEAAGPDLYSLAEQAVRDPKPELVMETIGAVPPVSSSADEAGSRQWQERPIETGPVIPSASSSHPKGAESRRHVVGVLARQLLGVMAGISLSIYTWLIPSKIPTASNVITYSYQWVLGSAMGKGTLIVLAGVFLTAGVNFWRGDLAFSQGQPIPKPSAETREKRTSEALQGSPALLLSPNAADTKRPSLSATAPGERKATSPRGAQSVNPAGTASSKASKLPTLLNRIEALAPEKVLVALVMAESVADTMSSGQKEAVLKAIEAQRAAATFLLELKSKDPVTLSPADNRRLKGILTQFSNPSVLPEGPWITQTMLRGLLAQASSSAMQAAAKALGVAFIFFAGVIQTAWCAPVTLAAVPVREATRAATETLSVYAPVKDGWGPSHVAQFLHSHGWETLFQYSSQWTQHHMLHPGSVRFDIPVSPLGAMPPADIHPIAFHLVDFLPQSELLWAGLAVSLMAVGFWLFKSHRRLSLATAMTLIALMAGPAFSQAPVAPPTRNIFQRIGHGIGQAITWPLRYRSPSIVRKEAAEQSAAQAAALERERQAEEERILRDETLSFEAAAARVGPLQSPYGLDNLEYVINSPKISPPPVMTPVDTPKVAEAPEAVLDRMGAGLKPDSIALIKALRPRIGDAWVKKGYFPGLEAWYSWMAEQARKDGSAYLMVTRIEELEKLSEMKKLNQIILPPQPVFALMERLARAVLLERLQGRYDTPAQLAARFTSTADRAASQFESQSDDGGSVEQQMAKILEVFVQPTSSAVRPTPAKTAVSADRLPVPAEGMASASQKPDVSSALEMVSKMLMAWTFPGFGEKPADSMDTVKIRALQEASQILKTVDIVNVTQFMRLLSTLKPFEPSLKDSVQRYPNWTNRMVDQAGRFGVLLRMSRSSSYKSAKNLRSAA